MSRTACMSITSNNYIAGKAIVQVDSLTDIKL